MNSLVDVGVNILFGVLAGVATMLVRPIMNVVRSSLLRPRERTIIVRLGDHETAVEIPTNLNIVDAVADIEASAEFQATTRSGR